MKTLLITLLTLGLFSCSGKQDSSSAGIQVFAGKLAISNATGGTMLWGKERGGNNSFGERLTSPNFEIELPNGIWDFYVIAWEGPEPMQGTPHCAASLGIELKGEAVNVALQSANSKCGQAPFNAYTFNNAGAIEFPQVKLKTCNEKATLNVDGCDTDYDHQGYVSSYNFSLPSYTKFAGETHFKATNSLIKNCTVVTLESMKMVANLGNLPLFGPNLPFLSVIRSHLGSDDCNEYGTGSGHIDTILNSGLPISQVPRLVNNVTGSGPYLATLAHQLTEADVCQGNRLTTSTSEPFAGGMGNADQPNLICTKAQLAKVYSEWMVNSNRSFWLLRDITLDRLAAPLVSMGDAYPSAVSTPYSGVFNGRGHSISNYYLNVESAGFANDVGFIRSLSGTVKNLKFLNAEVICDDNSTECNNVGILAGTSSGQISNVFVSGRIIGRSHVGGVIGAASSGNYDNIHAQVRIETRSINAGGLIGSSYGNLASSSASVDIYSEQNSVGGLVGYQFAGSINQSTARGTVVGDSKVGGLVGHLENTTSITSSYSTVNVHAHNSMSGPSLAAGGLVGFCDGTVTNSFSTEGSVTGNRNNSSDDYMAAVGGLVGEKGGSGSVTDSFFTGPDNSVIQQFGISLSPGKGAGTSVDIGNTAGQLYEAGTYTSWGTLWDGAGASTSEWAMTDISYDYPRLSWEIENSNTPTYLKRDCSGRYLLTTGAGTQTDPRWICTQAQFEAMNSSFHYILKRNIDYSHDPKTQRIFAAGTFKLNGNGHSLNSLKITNNGSSYSAIFENLSAASYIKNLKILNSKNYSSSLIDPSDDVHIALLAGLNSGVIENIVIDRSKVQIDSLNTTSSGTEIWIAGLVTRNYGTVKKVRSDVELFIKDADFTSSASDRLWLAGLVSENQGTVSVIKTNSNVRYISTFAGADPSATKFQIAGLVTFNSTSAVISEIQARADNYIEGMTSGGATLAGLVTSNYGMIKDVSLEASFRHNSIATTSEISGVVSTNYSAATVQRFINLGSDGESDYSNGVAAIDSFSLTANGTFTDVYCLADNENATGGFDDGNNVSNCLDLNNTDPEFTVDQISSNEIHVGVTGDSLNSTVTILGFSFTTNPNDTNATWLLNGDEAPEIRQTRFIGNF